MKKNKASVPVGKINTINLNLTENKIREGTSVFTICKNRNENFEKALATWVKYDNIDEIVVVDWNSDVPLKKYWISIKMGRSY